MPSITNVGGTLTSAAMVTLISWAVRFFHAAVRKKREALPAPTKSRPQVEAKPIQHTSADIHYPEDVESHPLSEELKGAVCFSVGSEGIAAGWGNLCPDVKRKILGHLSLNDLGRIHALCRDMRAGFLSRLAEEQAKLMLGGYAAFGKDTFSTVVRAFRRTLTNPRPGSYCLKINAAGKPEYVVSSEADIYHIASGTPSIFEGVSWCGSELLWKFPGSSSESGSIRMSVCPPLRFLRVTVSEGAGAAAVGLLLAMCRRNPDGTPAFRLLNLTTLQLELRRFAARKSEAEDLVGPLKALADSFTPFLIPNVPSHMKIGAGRPLGHLQLGYCNPPPKPSYSHRIFY